MNINPISFSITGASSLIGKVISIDEWAERMKIPDRNSGGYLSGSRISQILGIQSKSWEPSLFKKPETITSVGKAALASAQIDAQEVDAFILMTGTSFEITLGQDAFRFARELKLRDDIAPIQLEAGCGGMARVMNIARNLDAKNILVLAYNAISPLGEFNGVPNPLYLNNNTHPFRSILWASPGIFSDGAGAIVLTRKEKETGISFYSRDQFNFGDEEGFKDPIVHFPGGGVLIPPGSKDAEEMMCYSMSGKIIAHYYNKGMLLNHQTLLDHCPDYVNRMKRIYSHQAGPSMVMSFIDMAKLPAEKVPTHATKLGNLVSPCTIKLFHDDLLSGDVRYGDDVCFCVVGAGPERGAFTIRNEVTNVDVVRLT